MKLQQFVDLETYESMHQEKAVCRFINSEGDVILRKQLDTDTFEEKEMLTERVTFEDTVCFEPGQEGVADETINQVELYYGNVEIARRKIPVIYLGKADEICLTWELIIERKTEVI